MKNVEIKLPKNIISDQQTPNVVLDWLALPGSNFGQDTDYPDQMRWIYLVTP